MEEDAAWHILPRLNDLCLRDVNTSHLMLAGQSNIGRVARTTAQVEDGGARWKRSRELFQPAHARPGRLLFQPGVSIGTLIITLVPRPVLDRACLSYGTRRPPLLTRPLRIGAARKKQCATIVLSAAQRQALAAGGGIGRKKPKAELKGAETPWAGERPSLFKKRQICWNY